MSRTSSEANKPANKPTERRANQTNKGKVGGAAEGRAGFRAAERALFALSVGQVIANDELRSTHDILRITHEQALKQVSGSAAYGWHWPVQQSLRDR
jgi:hypothetical protein